MKNTDILEAVIQKLPYPQQIKEIDVTSEERAIRFRWRGFHFRVSAAMSVETVGNGVLIGSDESILLQKILGGPQ